MTPIDIARAYSEMTIPPEHLGELLTLLDEKNMLELVGEELSKLHRRDE